jgi:hypothetical protein
MFFTDAWESGLGRRLDSLTEAQQQTVLKLIIAGIESFAITTSIFGKIPSCTFLLFIVSPTDVIKRRTLYGVPSVRLTANIVCLIQIYAQCGARVEPLWDLAVAASTTCQSPMVQTTIGYGELSESSST